MGALRTEKRGKSWYYLFEIASVDGKRKRQSKGGFKTKKDAVQAGTIAMNEYNNKGYVEKSTELSFSDILDLMMDDIKNKKKHNTIVSYQVLIKNHVKKDLGKYKAKNITKKQLEDYIASKFKAGYSTNYVKHIFTVCKLGLQWAYDNGYIYVREYEKVTLGKSTQKKKNKKHYVNTKNDSFYVLSKAQYDTIKEFVANYNNGRYNAFIEFGYYTGCRIGEVVALDWKYIDFSKDKIGIHYNMSNQGKGFYNELVGHYVARNYIDTTKNLSSDRVINMGNRLKAILKAEKIRQQKERLKNPNYICYYHEQSWDETRNVFCDEVIACTQAYLKDNPHLKEFNPVFRDKTGKLITGNSIKGLTRDIREVLGLGFNYHTLRHTHATLLVESKAPLKAIADRLGHYDIQTLLNKYAITTDTMENDLVHIFDKLNA